MYIGGFLQFSEEKDNVLNLTFKANRSFRLGSLLLQLLKERILYWKRITRKSNVTDRALGGGDGRLDFSGLFSQL